MKIELKEKIGQGGFADVWLGIDELGRRVAIKIVRPSAIGIADALAHARALARAEHPNVVRVYSVESIEDPELGGKSDAVVMEYLDGETLTEYLSEGSPSLADLKRIGLALIDGIAHMHGEGLVHGDLHAENVIVTESSCKILDILYTDSLAAYSTESRASKITRDLLSLRLLIQDVIVHSELDAGEAVSFNQALSSAASIGQIRSAFMIATDAKLKTDIPRQIDHAYQRILDPAFVKGKEYALALADETPHAIVGPLLIRIITEETLKNRHRPYVSQLWRKASPDDRRKVVTALESALEKEVPKGNWSPHLKMLATLGKAGWSLLSRPQQIRIQDLVANDILAGRKDIYGTRIFSGGGGVIATYLLSLWRFMTNLETVSLNLMSMLRQGWYTQNYVGVHFMGILSSVVERTGDKEEMLEALKSAYSNDAKLVIANLDALPDEWQERIEEDLD